MPTIRKNISVGTPSLLMAFPANTLMSNRMAPIRRMLSAPIVIQTGLNTYTNKLVSKNELVHIYLFCDISFLILAMHKHEYSYYRSNKAKQNQGRENMSHC